MKEKETNRKLEELSSRIQALEVDSQKTNKEHQILKDLYGVEYWKPGLFYNIVEWFN